MKNVFCLTSANNVTAACNPDAVDWLVDVADVDAAVVHHNVYDGGSPKPPYTISSERMLTAIEDLWNRQVKVMMYVHPVFWRDSGRDPMDIVKMAQQWQRGYGVQGVYFDGVIDGFTMLKVCRELKGANMAVMVHNSYWMTREPNAHGGWIYEVDGVLTGELDLRWKTLGKAWYDYHRRAAYGAKPYIKHFPDPDADGTHQAQDEERAWVMQRDMGCGFRLSCGANIRMWCQTTGTPRPPAE